MIINRNESEVTVLGDVQKFKVGIDERNINHIVTILSSNLYSHPMQSFLRETVANAVDSQLEAGADEPIIITITDNDLAIRDFGTGISPERFQEIYTNIGSSTKRESNEYIGTFGIGRFSCLSVSDLANITSFYNGKAYYYVMNKDIDQLHIDLILEKDTDEHNGVEVKIPFKAPLQAEDWEALSYIKNLYVEDKRSYCGAEQSTIISSFNKRKVYSYETFKLLSIGSPYILKFRYTEVLVGDIPYRVDFLSLWDKEKQDNWAHAMEYVRPCLQIGEVDITPNREGLLYSERTKKALREAYTKTIDELTKLWEDSYSMEYTDFREFAFAIKTHWENTLTLNNVDIPIDNDLPYNIRMKDFPDCNYEEIKDIVRTLLNTSTDHIIACYHNDEMQKGRRLTGSSVQRLLEMCEDSYTSLVVVPNAYGFSGKYIKGFLYKVFEGKKVLFLREPHVTAGRIKSLIRSRFGITFLADKRQGHLVIACIRHLLKYIGQHSRKWDIINSPEYTQYKEDNKEERVYVRNSTKMTFHIWYPSCTAPETETHIPDDLMKILHCKFRHARIVYAPLDSPFIHGFKGISYPNLIIIGLSQNNYPLAEKGLFPQYVRPIEELYSPDNRILQRMAALEYIRSKTILRELDPAYPEPARIAAEELIGWSRKYPHERHYSYESDGTYDILKVVPEDKYDREILALYHQVRKYYEVSRKIQGIHHGDFFWYFLMKARKFRPDFEYYRHLRNDIEKISNLL